jgi:hypothetical protein
LKGPTVSVVISVLIVSVVLGILTSGLVGYFGGETGTFAWVLLLASGALLHPLKMESFIINLLGALVLIFFYIKKHLSLFKKEIK